MNDKTREILNDRGREYGPFTQHAEITQKLKDTISYGVYTNTNKFQWDHREALDMIAHKIGRIVNGNPNNEDSWRDIAGYATLVADRIARDRDNVGGLPTPPGAGSANSEPQPAPSAPRLPASMMGHPSMAGGVSVTGANFGNKESTLR